MSVTNYKILPFIILLFGLSLILLSGCSKEEKFEKDILAYVGDSKISVRDFQLNYEFGFAHLKKKGNEKLSYLELMINEKLLAQEGYRLKLDETEIIKNREKELLEELLVEEVFKREVDDKIHISEDDVKEAINKSNVKWKLRYWIEPDLDNAKKVYHEIKKNGYENTVQKLLKKHEVKSNIKDYETDYLTWLDVSPEFLDEIKELPLNQISKPIKINNVYILVEVTDIKANALADYDYQANYEKYRQILFYREQKKQTPVFIKRFMEPQNVVTKKNSLDYIFNAFLSWKKSGTNNIPFFDAIENAKKTEPELLKLKQHYNNILVSFKDGNWRIKDFLKQFNTSTITARVFEKGKIYNQINHEIAIGIRNKFFVEKALEQSWDKSKNIQKEIKMWRDKWVYDKLRRKITKKINIDKTMLLEFFNSNRNQYTTKENQEPMFKEVENQVRRDFYIEQAINKLEKKTVMLKKDFPVKINKKLLDSVKVSDSEKSRWSTVFLFKGNKKRMAIPTVDPSWVVQK